VERPDQPARPGFLARPRALTGGGSFRVSLADTTTTGIVATGRMCNAAARAASAPGASCRSAVV